MGFLFAQHKDRESVQSQHGEVRAQDARADWREFYRRRLHGKARKTQMKKYLIAAFYILALLAISVAGYSAVAVSADMKTSEVSKSVVTLTPRINIQSISFYTDGRCNVSFIKTFEEDPSLASFG